MRNFFSPSPPSWSSLPLAEADPYQGYTYEGECDGKTVRWCEHEVVQVMACDTDQICGLDTGANSYTCLD